jgi:hypothetical protein
MNFLKNKDKDGLFRSIFTAYLILLLHVILLAGVGVTILLFKGVYQYLHWIMAGIGLLVLGIAWVFYRRMKHSTTDIKSILSMPEFANRTVEIKLLGGLASFKIDAANSHAPQLEHTPDSKSGTFLIGHDVADTEQKLLRLNALFNKDLITREEYEKARQNILQG